MIYCSNKGNGLTLAVHCGSRWRVPAVRREGIGQIDLHKPAQYKKKGAFTLTAHIFLLKLKKEKRT